MPPPPAAAASLEYSRTHVAALWQYCRVPFTLPAYLPTKPVLPVRLVGSAAVLGVPPRRLPEPVRQQYYSALSVLRKYSLPTYSLTGALQCSRGSPALPGTPVRPPASATCTERRSAAAAAPRLPPLWATRCRSVLPIATIRVTHAVLTGYSRRSRLCGPHAADRCLRLTRTSRIHACAAHDHRPSHRSKACRRLTHYYGVQACAKTQNDETYARARAHTRL